MDLAEQAGLVPAHGLAPLERQFSTAQRLPTGVRQLLAIFQLGLTQFYLLIALLNSDPRGASLGYLQYVTSRPPRQLRPELSRMEQRGFIRWTEGCAELTESGREFAVYAIYRILTVADPGRGLA